MNREQKRKAAKKKKPAKRQVMSDDKFIKNFNWIQSLPSDKIEIIRNYGDMMIEEAQKGLVDAIDRCYSAALIEGTDLEFENIGKILDLCSDFLREDGNKMIANKKKNGGSIDIVMAKINDLAPAVRERVIKLTEEGKKQKEIIDILYLEFPLLSRAMIANAVKKTKAELKEVKIVEEVKQEVVEIEPVQAPIEEVAPDEVKEECEFEVINQILDVKGKYGEYHIEDKKVSWLDLVLEDNNDVESWAETSREMIREEINKLVAQIQEIDNREAEIKAVMKRFI